MEAWLDSSVPSTCVDCKAQCNHDFVPLNSNPAKGHYCTRCGLVSYKHSWVGGISSDKDVNEEPMCRCEYCGYTQEHARFDSQMGWCPVCYVRCVHSYVADDLGTMEQCSICGHRQYCVYTEGANGCICVNCGDERPHLFSGGKCIHCSAADPTGSTYEKTPEEIFKEEQLFFSEELSKSIQSTAEAELSKIDTERLSELLKSKETQQDTSDDAGEKKVDLANKVSEAKKQTISNSLGSWLRN